MMTPAVTWQSNPPEKLLKERFHISTGFHPGQRDIIEQLIGSKREEWSGFRATSELVTREE